MTHSNHYYCSPPTLQKKQLALLLPLLFLSHDVSQLNGNSFNSVSDTYQWPAFKTDEKLFIFCSWSFRFVEAICRTEIDARREPAIEIHVNHAVEICCLSLRTNRHHHRQTCYTKISSFSNAKRHRLNGSGSMLISALFEKATNEKSWARFFSINFEVFNVVGCYLVWMCGDSRRQFPLRYQTQISMIYILCSDEMRVLHPVSDVRTVLCNAMRMLCGYMREIRPIIKWLRDSGVECGWNANVITRIHRKIYLNAHVLFLLISHRIFFKYPAIVCSMVLISLFVVSINDNKSHGPILLFGEVLRSGNQLQPWRAQNSARCS